MILSFCECTLHWVSRTPDIITSILIRASALAIKVRVRTVTVTSSRHICVITEPYHVMTTSDNGHQTSLVITPIIHLLRLHIIIIRITPSLPPRDKTALINNLFPANTDKKRPHEGHFFAGLCFLYIFATRRSVFSVFCTEH